MLKTLIVTMGLAVSAGLALPAAAADDMAKKPMAGKKMAHSKAYKSCYDYAWESQDQKDCLAKHPDGMMSDKKPMGGKKAAMKKMG